MKNVKFFNLNFGTVLLRFYLMMGVVIAAGFSGYWLVGLLALPIFLSIMLGVSFKFSGFEKQGYKKQIQADKYPSNLPTPSAGRSTLELS